MLRSRKSTGCVADISKDVQCSEVEKAPWHVADVGKDVKCS